MIPENRVGFLFLMPRDLRWALRSLHAIQALHQQVEGSEITLLTEHDHSWIASLLPFSPSNIPIKYPLHKMVHSLGPLKYDWIIDLRGKMATWRFKNRLKTLDRTIRYKKNEDWEASLFQLLDIFDVKNDLQNMGFQVPKFDLNKLPEVFKRGYLTLFLDHPAYPDLPVLNPMVDLLTRTERYTVICGNKKYRPLADKIGQKVGCTTFVTCGDFSQLEMAALLNDSAGVITFDNEWSGLANLLQKKCHTLTVSRKMAIKDDTVQLAELIR